MYNNNKILIGKKHLIWILSFILLSGFLTTSLFSYFVAKSSLTYQITERSLPLITDKIYSEIKESLSRHTVIAFQMAKNTFVRDWVINGEKDASKIENYLRSVKESNKTFTSFFISDNSKRYYHPNKIIRHISESNPGDAWYFKKRPVNKDFEVIVSEDEMNQGSLSIFINHKVFDYNNNFIGITGVGLILDTVQMLIDSYHADNGMHIYIINSNGKIIFNNSTSANQISIFKDKHLSKYADDIYNSHNKSITYKNNGKTVFLNSRLIEEFGWYLIVEENEDVINFSTMKILSGNLFGAFIVTIIVLFLSNFTIKGYQQRLEEMATTDHLTQSLNRRAFEILFQQTIKSAKRGDHQIFSIALFDIDNFKNINDKYGHIAGDKVIYTTASIIKNHIRESDIFCRWGGEEFLLLLPECESKAAMIITEKIREIIYKEQIQIENELISITISIGVASYISNESEEALIQRADKALYTAKKTGKNKVEIAS